MGESYRAVRGRAAVDSKRSDAWPRPTSYRAVRPQRRTGATKWIEHGLAEDLDKQQG